MDPKVGQAFGRGSHPQRAVRSVVVVFVGPSRELNLKVLKGDPQGKLPIKLLVIGLMRSFDLAVEFFDPGWDEFVKDVEGGEVFGKQMFGQIGISIDLEAIGKGSVVIGLNALDGKGSRFF